MDHKRDSQETDFVISPIIESGTSWTVISDAVAQITMIIRPSQKTRNNYPEQMDALQHARNYSIPYRDIIGQIIGTFATVNGERVFYVGEIQSFGYWNLSRSMRNRMKKWMPFIIGRLEEKLSSIGIKTIYIEDLGILGSLTPKNAMIHYGVLLNEEYGYKRTVVNVSFYPKSKEENKKCMYKHIFKKESKPAEGQEKFVEKTIYEKTHRLPKKIVDNIDNRAEMNDMDDMIGLYWLIFKPRWTTKYYRMMKIHLRNAIKMQGKDISHTPTPRIWVYRDESGRVRGYTTVLLSKGSDEMIKVHIAEAAVDENCQNQGIAYALKAVMMEDMQALGATLFTTNPTGKKTEDEKKYISEVMAEEFGFKWAENGSNKMVFDAAKLSKKEEKLIKVEGEKAKSAKPVKVKIDETSKANVLIEVSL